MVDAQDHGIICLRALVLSIERGEAKLPLDLHAWENTMTALEWMLTRHLEGPYDRNPPFALDDLERVRHVHALGTEAISRGERSPELGPFAERCLSSMISGWRTASPDLPICYPVPEGYEQAPERRMPRRP